MNINRILNKAKRGRMLVQDDVPWKTEFDVFRDKDGRLILEFKDDTHTWNVSLNTKEQDKLVSKLKFG